MAVAQPGTTRPTMIRNYWPRFHRRAVLITILMQITGTLTVACALIITNVAAPTISFSITLIAVLTSSVGINLILTSLLTTPLKDLASALTHVSGEPSLVTPPNPNARHFEQDGFKPLLQLIYEMATFC